MKTPVLLFLAFLFIAAQPAISCIVFYESTAFTIIDAKSKIPLAGASIVVMKNGVMHYQRTTDSLGKIDLYLAGDEYTFRILHPAYLPFVHKTRVDEDYKLHVEVRLSNTRKNKAHEYITKVNRHAGIKRTHYQSLDADAASDEHFNNSSCRMKHTSRKAWQSFMGSARFSNIMLLYPNPVTSQVLYIESRFDELKTIVVYDMAGKEHIRSAMVLHRQLDVSRLPIGVYFLKMIDEKNNDVTVEKFVVQ